MLPSLIQWFETADLPQAPFYLGRGLSVPEPSRYYAALRRDIAGAGSPGSRAALGLLEADLCRLRGWCVTRGET